MRKTDMMKLFTNEVATCLAEGWVLAPNNSCMSDGVVRVKLEREGELQTLQILNTMELAYDTYVVERINDITGQTLDQQTYYYLWAWRRENENDHEIVTKVKELVKEGV